MDKRQKFGLIGKNISYSFSKKYFEKKFKALGLKNHFYDLFDIDEIYQVENILNDPFIKGINVTIPYKELIISYLDELNEEAEKIGAVNCVAIKNGKKTGYNTDVFGFEKTLTSHSTCMQENALILGNGGVVKAVKYVLEKYNIPYTIVSRKSEINFENLTKEIVNRHTMIIQCTPVGTFPNINDCLKFPFDASFESLLVIDLIYNPTETKFLKECKKRGAKTVNGLLMLEQQAEKAWKIWK